MGTDLRKADLTGTLLDQNALDQSYWNGARGVSQGLAATLAYTMQGLTQHRRGDGP